MAGISQQVEAPPATRFADPLEGLTHRMHRFATLVVSGMSNMDAYRQAYQTEPESEGTVKTRASELARHPQVLSKIIELRAKAEAQSTLFGSLSRSFVLNGIMSLALSAEKETVRLDAYKTLGKTVGIDLFRDTVVHETRARTPEQVEQELKEKLDAMRAGLTIDGAARQVEPDSPKHRERRRKPKS